MPSPRPRRQCSRNPSQASRSARLPVRTRVTEQCASAAAIGPASTTSTRNACTAIAASTENGQHRSERSVDRDEAATRRVPEQVAEGQPEGGPRPHPLTPAVTAPDTKKRWKARKTIRTGMIAMMLPAVISGHRLEYSVCKLWRPSWMV